MLLRFTTFALVALLLTGACAEAQQQGASRLDDVVSRGTLKVGTTGDYRPFTYLNRDTSRYEGLDIDMANALGQALGVKVEFVQTSWPTLMKDFEADRFDIAMSGISITLDRQRKGLFSSPLLRDGKTPIARCTDQGKYETLADIDKPGVRVIVNPGGTNERFARAHAKNAEIKVHNDNVTIFEEIASGRADLMITDSTETRYQQKKHAGVLCAVHPDKPFDFAEKAYWLQRDPSFKAFVDQWLHIAKEKGDLSAAFGKWFN